MSDQAHSSEQIKWGELIEFVIIHCHIILFEGHLTSLQSRSVYCSVPENRMQCVVVEVPQMRLTDNYSSVF